MKHDETSLRTYLRAAVAGAMPALADHKLAQMERDVAEGWRCFHTRALWARDNAPGPHINELGRRILSEMMMVDLFKEPGDYLTAYKMDFMLDFLDRKEARHGYRNLFALGTLDLEAGQSDGKAWDEEVNDTANRLFRDEHRHVMYELRYQRSAWYLEGVAKGTLTPAPTLYERDPVVAVRDPSRALEDDYKYWHAVYPITVDMLMDPLHRHVQTKPECTLDMMRQLAPDFPYAPQLSTLKRLVFIQVGDSPLAWATLIEKPDGAAEYSYPPRLVLIRRDLKNKLQPKHFLFTNVIVDEAPQMPLWPREVEITLMFHIPRIRRLIDLYEPIVTQTLSDL